MPNSTWTETGSSVNLVPVTTSIPTTDGHDSLDYLTNGDKIDLMEQYASELATKTSLDTLAATWTVSATFYNNAVAAISTALIGAGAPSNWATTWPDGTTSGPWSGIKTSLSNLWAQIATQRSALQSSISSSQAAAAQAAAIATAATSAASIYATTIDAPAVVSSLPTLPSASYPSGKLVWNTGDGKLYRSSGSAWVSLDVDATDINGTLTDAQIAALAASKITGQLTDTQLAGIAAAKVSGTLTDAQLAAIAASKITGTISTAQIASSAVDMSKLATGIRPPRVVAALPVSPWTGYAAGDTVVLTTDNKLYRFTGAAWTTSVATTDLSGTVSDAQIAGMAAGKVTGTLNDSQLAAIAAAKITGSITTTQITDNAITTAKVAAGAITASEIAADTITASQIAAGAITSSELATGAVVAGKIAAGTIQAADIAAGTITGAKIAATTITATNIAANTITSNEIAADTITAGQIAAGAVGASEIAAGSITTAALTVCNFDNLIPNASTEQAAPTGGWPTGALEAVWNDNSGANAYTGTRARASNVVDEKAVSPWITCAPGDQFYFEAYTKSQFGDVQGRVILGWSTNGTSETSWSFTTLTAPTTYTKTSVHGTAPASCVAMRFKLCYLSTSTPNEWLWFDALYARRMADANLIVDGTITAAKIAAGTITSNEIAAGTIVAADIAASTITGANIAGHTITAANITADTITASEIAAGAITSSELAAGSVIAGKIAAGTIVAGDIAASTITGAKIAGTTITAANIAAGTITATEIATDTITAGQIATGAIGASEIAAGSITTAALTVCNFDNLFPNPTSEATAPTGGWPSGAWESVCLSTSSPYAGTHCRLATTSTPTYQLLTPMIPVNAGDQFVLQFYGKVASGSVAIDMIFQDAAGASNLAIAQVAVTAASYTKYTIQGTAPATSGRMFICVDGVPAANLWMDNFYLRRMADGSLLVDGCITASKIATGAITADMITTGTLNAANVAVTNLNASNITTGVLSAGKVQFGDGSALTTATRTSVYTANGTTSNPAMVLTTMTLIPELTVTVTAASTADVFLVTARANFIAGLNAFVTMQVFVDGVAQANTFAGQHSTTNTGAVYLLSSTNVVTGLSAGTHTIAIYGNTNSSVADHWYSTWRNLTVQRTY